MPEPEGLCHLSPTGTSASSTEKIPAPNPASQAHLMARTTYISASIFRMSDIPARRKKELAASYGVISLKLVIFSLLETMAYLQCAYLMANGGPKDLN